MILKLKKIASIIGIDKAILLTSSSRILSSFGSVFTIVLLVKYMSSIEQGYYYTFSSIAAIQVFFELGLNGIITQYTAHEASNLRFEGKHILIGKQKYLSRLSSLLHFSIKWYIVFASFLLVTLILIGVYFFNKYDNSDQEIINWTWPWILLALGTSFNLVLSPILAFLQGLGKVKEVAKIQFIVLILTLTSVWLGLVAGLNLFVLGLSSLVNVFFISLIIIKQYRKLIYNIWKVEIVEKVHYRKEIFPFQWKIALSWISGYFVFQLFNPILFASEGAVVAGQMGMTLVALNGILSLSYAWMSTKVPLFSGLIAQNKFNQLDSIFNKTLNQSSIVNLGGLVFFALALFLIRFFNLEIGGNSFGNRFLDYGPLLLMMVPVLLNHISGSWAVYLRCHKKEPFLIFSIVTGILTMLSTVFLGTNFGIQGLTIGYFFIMLFTFPWAYQIFKTKKKDWHATSI
jgi:O-antigen/teichoic acid export membrane protein